VTEFVQQLVDGLGRGGIYALLALGLAVVFGVLHLLNFAHGEQITIAGYTVYGLATLGADWWLLAPAAIVAAALAGVATEKVAFRWVRGASPFTLLLTSFGVSIVIQAAFRSWFGGKARKFSRPGWVFDTVRVGGINLEVYDLMVMAITAVTLIALLWLMRRTMFGLALRGSAEDFDAARLMGVRADRIISGAFALAGALAGVAAALILIRRGEADPQMGLDPLLKAVVATIIGGLGSLTGAVAGGVLLGLAEVAFRAWLPDSISGLTDGFVFALIGLLLVFRPHGLIDVQRAERV
jgi:branched-chain amino acid transport system permease protein